MKKALLPTKPPLKIISPDIITISGPSGAGKSAIAKGLKKKIGRSARVVPSYMTRRRPKKKKEKWHIHHQEDSKR